MQFSPHLNRSTGNAQFEVRLSEDRVTAFVSETAWRARFGDASSDSSFLELLMANQAVLVDAVTRRVAAGARQPVVLRVADL